ncbi:MAG: phage tail tape measure protein [Atopobiaceae bacterium]|jgi:phage-related minor tail protein|nr:phage tail tape measure protein [Atopobiaceae bacterium]
MAARVRGITIKLNGDSTGLTKALSDVNQKCKSVQTQLKDVNRLLKLDPGNTELIAQKQKLLAQAVDETKNKQKALQQAAAEAKKQMESGTEGAQKEYDALQREIVQTTDDLKSLEKQAKQSSSTMGTELQAAGSKISSVGGKITSAGTKLSSTVTAGIAATGAAAMAAFEEVDGAEDEAVRKTGATGDAAKELSEDVRTVGASLSAANSDWTTIGDTVGSVSTKFGVTGSDLDTLSEKFLEFGQNTGADTSTAIEQVSLAMDAFGVSSDQAGNVLGLLQDTTQTTGVSIDTLMQDLNSSGASFREMGFSIGDATEFMGSLEKEGIPVDQALAGFKKAAANCAKSGKDMGTEMRSLAERLKDPATQAQATQDAMTLFGNKSGLVLAQAMADGKVSLDGMSGDLSKYAGTVDDTFNQTVDGADKMKQSWKQLQEAGADLGGAVGDTLAPILQQAAGFLKGLADGFAALPQPVQQAIVTVLLVVAAVGPLLVMIGSVISAVGTITTAIGVAMPIIGGLAAGLLPFAPIILGIIAAIVAIILIIQNWGAICQFFGDLWNGWSQGVVAAWDAVEGYFAGVGQWWSDRFSEWGSAIQAGGQQIADYWRGKWDEASQKASDTWSAMQAAGAQGMSDLNTNVQNGWSAVSGFFSGLPGWASSTGDSIFSSLRSAAQNVMSNLDIEGRFWSSVNFLGNLWGQFQSWGSDAINGFASGVTSAMSGLMSTVSSMASQIASYLHFSRPDKGPLRDYESWMPDFVGTMAGQITRLSPKMAQAVRGLSSTMTLSPQMQLAAASASGTTDYSGALSGISNGIQSLRESSGGKTVIPVYLGNSKLEEFVIDANRKSNFRSGGK